MSATIDVDGNSSPWRRGYSRDAEQITVSVDPVVTANLDRKMQEANEFLRHALATLAYRAAKPLGDPPDGFGETRSCPTCRSALEIVAHLGDLLEWALTAVQGRQAWKPATPASLPMEIARFTSALESLDRHLASEPLGCSLERLFQGPIADAFTHVGQLATLRRIAGSPVRGENYYVADIRIGDVGPSQAAPKIEFD